MNLSELSKSYRQCSLIVFNTIILLIIINLLLTVVIKVRESHLDTGQTSYSMELLKELYPDMTEEQIKILLKETWIQQDFGFYPYIQFKENPKNGTFVNKEQGLFRESLNQCEYPINNSNYNIFVFGGSATFGYGVKDNETIPSKIQEILSKECSKKLIKVCTYNFGAGAFYSSQERVFFETQLAKNQSPNMVIFVDGLNDMSYPEDAPSWSDTLKSAFSWKGALAAIIKDVPLTRAVKFITGTHPIHDVTYFNDSASKIVQRYFLNKKMIESTSRGFNITSYFVIQPLSSYNYNFSYHFLSQQTDFTIPPFPPCIQAGGYPLLVNRTKSLNKIESKNVIILSDIQINKTENLYVDLFHYSPRFITEISQKIVDRIEKDVC